jgi:hypothetical protein
MSVNQALVPRPVEFSPGFTNDAPAQTGFAKSLQACLEPVGRCDRSTLIAESGVSRSITTHADRPE